MEMAWIGCSIIISVWAGVVSARLWRYRRQIRHMLEELREIGKGDTNSLLTSLQPVGETENVITAINEILDGQRHAREQLVRENRIYRESITSISHDIRTPLTSAKGYVQMLGDVRTGEEKRKAYQEIVERRLTDLSKMLDQLFLYARLEAGEEEFDWEKLNVGNLFAETLSLFYEEFAGRGQEPVVEIPTGAFYIRADRGSFVRIVENLLKNALVHGTGGYGFRMVCGGDRVKISVENRTDSICVQDMDSIFDRFYTTDTSRSRRTTGLGLAIVKELTTRMGGEVSARLDGSLFRVEVSFPCLQNG